MQFGLTVSSDDRFDADVTKRLASHVERATCARDAGFDYVSVTQRYSLGPSASDERGEALKTSRFQPLLLLAHLSGKLGADFGYVTNVMVSTGLHPVQLAEDLATLDVMCGGNLRIGIGLGWHPYELAGFGVDRTTRVKRFEELITITRALLTQESVTYHGDFFDVTDSHMVARSLQRPSPPLWLGASVDAAVKRAARLGDSWLISSHHPLAELVPQMALYKEELAKLNKPLPNERPIVRQIYIAEDRQTALDQAQPIFAEMYRQRQAAGWFLAGDRQWGSDIEDMYFIVGDPANCIKQIEELRDELDVNMISLVLPPGSSDETWIRTINLLGKEVLPHLR